MDEWLTLGRSTIDRSNVSAASGKAIVSIACSTGRNLGPDAVTAGVDSWLGFTMKFPVITPYLTQDPIGDAIAESLECLGHGKSLQDARDKISVKLSDVADEYDTGAYSGFPDRWLGYFSSLSLASHVVVHGNTSACLL